MILSQFSPSVTAWAVTLLTVAGIAATIRMVAPDYAGVRTGRPDAGYLESNNCRKCHETNYSTWHATFHRTMTQEADQKSVLGDFERDNTITYQGVRAEMVRENGRYWMKFTGVRRQEATTRRSCARLVLAESSNILLRAAINGSVCLSPTISCSTAGCISMDHFFIPMEATTSSTSPNGI